MKLIHTWPALICWYITWSCVAGDLIQFVPPNCASVEYSLLNLELGEIFHHLWMKPTCNMAFIFDRTPPVTVVPLVVMALNGIWKGLLAVTVVEIFPSTTILLGKYSSASKYKMKKKSDMITSKILAKIGKMSEILETISHISKKNQKFTATNRPNFDFLASFLKKKFVQAWIWENQLFVKNSQNVTVFVKISQIFHNY